MNDHEPGPRRYTEKEVSLILRRATELQTVEPTALDPAGLTLGDLEEIAAEAGIDPVIQAATAGQGTASAVGRTLTWNSRTESNMSPRQVLISAHDGVTVIRIEESFGGLSASLFGGIMGGDR